MIKIPKIPKKIVNSFDLLGNNPTLTVVKTKQDVLLLNDLETRKVQKVHLRCAGITKVVTKMTLSIPKNKYRKKRD